MSRLRIVAVGHKMPDWVQSGFDEYRKRMPREYAVELKELAPVHRGKNADVARAIEQEGEQVLAALAPGDHVVALEVKGKSWSTEALAEFMQKRLDEGERISFLIGGADGLSAACRQRAQTQWSLSALTLPHPLVRVLLMEQLYRAWSILHSHPYHR